MRHIITVILIAAGALLSTSCMKDTIHQTKMKEVEGEYELVKAKELTMPDDDFNIIKGAKIYNNQGKWLFEYTIPIKIGYEKDKMAVYTYHHIAQEIEWNESIKEYVFHKLTEDDTANTELFPDDIITIMTEKYILTKHRRHGNLTLTWYKK